MQNAIPTSSLVLAAFAAVLVYAMSSVPAAAQGTPEQRAACQGDAQRLCGQFIPDVERITACMVQNRRYVSRPCRLAIEAGRKRGRTRN
jgi:type II secretory pathway component PulL